MEKSRQLRRLLVGRSSTKVAAAAGATTSQAQSLSLTTCFYRFYVFSSPFWLKTVINQQHNDID